MYMSDKVTWHCNATPLMRKALVAKVECHGFLAHAAGECPFNSVATKSF